MVNSSAQRISISMCIVAFSICLLVATLPGGSLHASAENSVALEEILALDADPDYGEYLASECMTCHTAEKTETNIPVIHGKESGYLAGALLEYKNKKRENATMQSVAGALGNEEIAALVAYLSQL